VNKSGTNPLLYVACYAIWLALCAALLWLFLQLRTNVIDFAYLFGASEAMVRFLDAVAVIPLALILVGAGIWLEGALRDSVREGRLWAQAAKSALVVVGVIAASYLLHVAVVALRLGV
jgi:hypothetical protein